MADNYQEFSEILENITEEECAWLGKELTGPLYGTTEEQLAAGEWAKERERH